jgi:hypothetical protein
MLLLTADLSDIPKDASNIDYSEQKVAEAVNFFRRIIDEGFVASDRIDADRAEGLKEELGTFLKNWRSGRGADPANWGEVHIAYEYPDKIYFPLDRGQMAHWSDAQKIEISFNAN